MCWVSKFHSLTLKKALTLLVGFWGDGILFALLHGDLLSCYFIINGGEVLLRQILTVVNATVHLNVLFFCHLALHLR